MEMGGGGPEICPYDSRYGVASAILLHQQRSMIGGN